MKQNLKQHSEQFIDLQTENKMLYDQLKTSKHQFEQEKSMFYQEIHNLSSEKSTMMATIEQLQMDKGVAHRTVNISSFKNKK